MMVKREWNFQQWLQQSEATLSFPDGTTFGGTINLPSNSPLLKDGIYGESAFTTGMSGYEETATDPSFLGQHIIYTTAHVGNYESNKAVRQSNHCFATSLIARNFSPNEFLHDLQVPLFTCFDTRALTRYITSVADHRSCLTLPKHKLERKHFDQATYHVNDLARVSQRSAEVLRSGDRPIVLLNYGVKRAIIQQLLSLGFPLVSLPHNASAEEVMTYNPRLIFLSNGPGDPRLFTAQVQEVKKLLKTSTPIRGICLGHQFLTLSLGAEIIKLPFGQRGTNHPVLDHLSGNVLITSQNHGYATQEASLKAILKNNPLGRELCILNTSLFDQSVEGMGTTDGHMRSVQFHPESNPGPDDAHPFFTEIKHYLTHKKPALIDTKSLRPKVDLQGKNNPIHVPYKRLLIVGSGPIKIGQASEFDYSGTQACKALRELGLEVVLVNSNPATIMTDPDMANKTYIEPITSEVVKKIILDEQIDAVISTMGGQTALNLCVELEDEGFFDQHNVKLLGARGETIRKTEDRELFAKELEKLGYQCGKRFTAHHVNEAIMLSATKVGYPLIIRRDFALGGRGSALVYTEAELRDVLETTDIKFPITLEKSLVGYKELELELMVDCEQNGLIICSIENVDPCGIHTGDSITVAPAQTISDRCLQKMRTMALTIAKHMGVVAGGANVQFAVNPHDEDDITVIEMNPRVSRSSALASKATGYPIAKISAQLAVGLTMRDIVNDITKTSPVAFEPTLDYVAVKIPIFPFNKFPTSSTTLGPQMRSVGEVLALGGSFNEAFLKALRALELGLEIPTLTQLKTSPVTLDNNYLLERLKTFRELSLVSAMDAMRAGIGPEEIQNLTRISPWFIGQVGQIVEAEDEIKNNGLWAQGRARFIDYKRRGMSDKHLAMLGKCGHQEVFDYRMREKIFPCFKAVDTCSGEFVARTPYFYSTYSQVQEAVALNKQGRSVAVMGSGPNRIGQGIEFDYSCVKSCMRLKQHGIQSIMLNSNPETVSTDYDTSDRLYLTPLYSEDLFDIFMFENPEGIIASFAGQTGIKIRKHLETSFRKEYFRFNFLGPGLETIDLTEDRKLFAELTTSVDLAQTRSMEVKGHKQLVHAIIEIGPPVIIRPSYVIGGESMYIFHSADDIALLPPQLQEQLKHSGTIFQVENYLQEAIEYDVDLVRDAKGHCIFTVCEHIEHAGVHSGDSGMITPPVTLTAKLFNKMLEISKDLAEKLNVIGPINFQYAVKDGKIYCIEANPRGSRTLPFISKAYHLDLPGLATDAMLGQDIADWHSETNSFFSVKQSTFPFDRFVQDNIILGPKMRSTGETMGIDRDKDAAILKSYLGNYPNLRAPGKILISLADQDKPILLPYLKQLRAMGLEFFATKGTYDYIRKQGIPAQMVLRLSESGINMLDVIKMDDMRVVFNTPGRQGSSKSDGEYIRNAAIQYGIPCFTRKENIRALIEALLGCYQQQKCQLYPLAIQDAYQEISLSQRNSDGEAHA